MPYFPEDTVRHQVVALLLSGEVTVKVISAVVGIPEKEVPEHLEHIRKSMRHGEYRFTMIPAFCRSCGFVFDKRTRLRKPGKCPICKNSRIGEPSFGLHPL